MNWNPMVDIRRRMDAPCRDIGPAEDPPDNYWEDAEPQEEDCDFGDEEDLRGLLGSRATYGGLLR